MVRAHERCADAADGALVKRCRECGAARCMCAARASLRLVSAEWDAAERVIEHARQAVLVARMRGERFDGCVRLADAVEEYDRAVEARRRGA